MKLIQFFFGRLDNLSPFLGIYGALLLIFCASFHNNLSATDATPSWIDSWEGEANGSHLIMVNEIHADQLSGTIRDPSGYTYTVNATVANNTATGIFADPQTGAVLQCQMELNKYTLSLKVLNPQSHNDVLNPLLELTFYPPGQSPELQKTQPANAQMDPAMVGIWKRTESSTDANGAFSFVVEWTLILNGDGSFIQTSKSAGGTLGVTGNSEPQIIAQGKWKTTNKVLWIDQGAGLKPFVRYLVDSANMMFLFQDDSRQLWSRGR
jgi:hypothetical protein